MENLILDPKSVNVLEGDFTHSNNWIYEFLNGKTISEKNNWIMFESNGSEVLVDFDLEVIGKVELIKEDDLTPDHFDEKIESFEVLIKSVEIDGNSVDLKNELVQTLTNLIKKLI